MQQKKFCLHLTSWCASGIALVFVGTVGTIWHFRSSITKRFLTKPYISIESDESRTHVFLTEKGQKEQLSTSSDNHRDPFWRGDYVVWVEEPQDKSEKYIARYHIPTKTVTKLTTQNVAQRPRVSTEGYVVWQGWTDDGWHVFYYDGTTTEQITSDEPAIHPDIANTDIVFARKSKSGIWRAEQYHTKERTTTVIK